MNKIQHYFIKRFLLIFPTVIGISFFAFILINLNPGGPIDKKLMDMQFRSIESDLNLNGHNSVIGNDHTKSDLPQSIIVELNKQYGLDKSVVERFIIWIKNLYHLDFGDSFVYNENVKDVILKRLPTTLFFGFLSFILTYMICIPFGLLKAYFNNSFFDYLSSFVLLCLYCIPSFILAICLIVYLSRKDFFNLLPLGGIKSEYYEHLNFNEQIIDRFKHAILPIICYISGHLATVTFLTRNSILEEVHESYVQTAWSKGLSKSTIYLKHILKNALIPLISDFPKFISIFLTGAILIETIFQLDGIGLLSYNSILSRDYNVLMCIILIKSVLVYVIYLLSDIGLYLLDKRINYS